MICPGLYIVKLCIYFTFSQKFFMRTFFCNKTITEYNYLISIANGTKAMSYYDYCSPDHQFLQRLHNSFFRFCIEGCRWLVKNKNWRITYNSTGNTYTLPLAAGKRNSPFSNQCVIAMWHL